ncbi:hypothetical protein eKKP3263_000040 [Enterobacter phage KKP_3263]|uniref:Outer membrane protein n=1 Tax=Enterobacter phage KKP_3263 TaxID=2875358 RepID=A0ABY3P9R6_9CAUD|nr:hypothetical protein eKKP3263_000040 [Enterobacter phage KKP_3263]
MVYLWCLVPFVILWACTAFDNDGNDGYGN